MLHVTVANGLANVESEGACKKGERDIEKKENRISDTGELAPVK